MSELASLHVSTQSQISMNFATEKLVIAMIAWNTQKL